MPPTVKVSNFSENVSGLSGLSEWIASGDRERTEGQSSLLLLLLLLLPLGVVQQPVAGVAGPVSAHVGDTIQVNGTLTTASNPCTPYTSPQCFGVFAVSLTDAKLIPCELTGGNWTFQWHWTVTGPPRNETLGFNWYDSQTAGATVNQAQLITQTYTPLEILLAVTPATTGTSQSFFQKYGLYLAFGIPALGMVALQVRKWRKNRGYGDYW